MICKFQEKKKDRMYKCTECSRSFDYEKNLERHMAKHKEGTLKEGDDQQVISRDFPILFFTKFVYSLYKLSICVVHLIFEVFQLVSNIKIVVELWMFLYF